MNEVKNLAKNTGVKYVFPISYAGFFAKRHMMFFLPSSFRICPPLKNDGTSELRFDVVLNAFLAKKKRIRNVSCPRLSGKVSTGRLTKGASVSRCEKQFLAKRH